MNESIHNHIDILSVTFDCGYPRAQQSPAVTVAVLIVPAGHPEAHVLANHLRQRGFGAVLATPSAHPQSSLAATISILVDLRPVREPTHKALQPLEATVLHLTHNCCISSSLKWLQRQSTTSQAKPFPIRQLLSSICDYLHWHQHFFRHDEGRRIGHPAPPGSMPAPPGGHQHWGCRRDSAKAKLVTLPNYPAVDAHRSQSSMVIKDQHSVEASTPSLKTVNGDSYRERVAVFSTSRRSLLAWPVVEPEAGGRTPLATKCLDNPESLLAFLADAQTKVVFLDAALIDSPELEFLAMVRTSLPVAELVLLLSRPLSLRDIERTLSHGVRGCLPIDSPLALYLKVAAAVCRGEYWLPRWAMAHAISALLGRVGSPYPRKAQPPETPLGIRLTEREQGIASLLRLGLSNKEIGRRLQISDATVKKHLKSLFEKLGVHRRTDLIVKQNEERRSCH